MLNFTDSGLDKNTWNTLRKLSTPSKIQDYINTLPFNFEKSGETCMSPARAIKACKAHCFEGALISATALWIQGRKPLLLDLVSTEQDFDHVVAVFKEESGWGAISKTNHAVLRYREPVYKNVRELVMSYFHEYFLHDGTKTLRSFSKPFDLSRLGTQWISAEEELFDLAHALDTSPHTQILSPQMVRKLRKADSVEIQAGKVTEYP